MAGSATIMNGIQSLLQALGTFANADVTQGDFRVLDRGGAPYAVIYPGGFETIYRSDDGAEIVIRWTHYIEVFATFLDDDYSHIVSARQDVMDQLNKYPSLDGTAGVLRGAIEGGEDLRFLYPPGGDVPHFVFARLVHRAEEYVSYADTGEF